VDDEYFSAEEDNQDLARHLGQPLYQLSSEVDSLFAYGKSSVFNQILPFD
jgi:hypothetical protein